MKFLEHIELNPKVVLEKGKVYPFIEMASVGTENREPIVVADKTYSSGVKFEDGDTVIARIEPCLQNGKKFRAKNIGKGFGSTEFLVFRPKDESVDSAFLYYFMQTDFIKKSMIGSMTGSTGRQRVNNDIFKTMDIDIPSIDSQRRIGEILSAYDDLIENCQKQISILEESALRIYKEWFVNLKFPNYDNSIINEGIPSGWGIKVGKELYEIKTGKKDANQSVENGEFPFFTCARDDLLKSNDFVYDGKVILISGNGSYTGFVKRYSGKFDAYQRTYYLSEFDDRMWAFLYCNFKTDFERKYMGGTKGSAIPYITKPDLEKYEILIPSEEVLIQFDNVVLGILQEIDVLQSKVRSLIQARDNLLPKLMSREIEV